MLDMWDDYLDDSWLWNYPDSMQKLQDHKYYEQFIIVLETLGVMLFYGFLVDRCQMVNDELDYLMFGYVVPTKVEMSEDYLAETIDNIKDYFNNIFLKIEILIIKLVF